jgi:hypothetical protein
MAGELPHADFHDYTGGLTAFMAAQFAILGVDALWPRIALLCGAVIAVLSWYRIALRFASPWPAVAVSSICLVWSFPNYFASLPSWWILIFASLATDRALAYSERRRAADLFLFGLLCGLAFAFKQTGLYLIGAATLWLAFVDHVQPARPGTQHHPTWWTRHVVPLGALVALGAVFLPRLTLSEFIVLIIPPLILSLYLLQEQASHEHVRRSALPFLNTAAIFLSGTAVPIVLLLLPYVVTDSVADLVEGLFLRPGGLRAVSMGLPSLWLAIAGVPVYVALIRVAMGGRASPRDAGSIALGCYLLVLGALYQKQAAYLLMWSAVRALTPVAVIAALLQLRGIDDDLKRKQVYLLAAFAAFTSLIQYPFAVAIYFCYAAPFCFLLLFAVLRLQGWLERPVEWLPAAAIALFAIVALNPGYVYLLGAKYEPKSFPAELGIDRARLLVSPEDARVYSRVVDLIRTHSKGDYIYAAPDCPEVYFLAAKRNPRRVNFDFFEPTATADLPALWRKYSVDVVVLNHRPMFSAAPVDEAALAQETFHEGVQVGQFEVRWSRTP